MQPVIPLMTAGPGRRRRLVPPGPQGQAGPVRLAVVPGRLDQQPAGVGVPGLGDRPLGAFRTRGALGGHQPQVGADAAAGEPLPVTDLDREREAGQRGDAPQTRQPSAVSICGRDYSSDIRSI